MVSYAVIGKHLKEARLRLGLSQAEVAHRITRSTTYYGKIERGEIKPNIDRLADISQVLNLPFESLFRGSFIPEGSILDNVPPTNEEFDTFIIEVGNKASDRTKTIIMRICAELSNLDAQTKG